jgi:hypothetical protein
MDEGREEMREEGFFGEEGRVSIVSGRVSLPPGGNTERFREWFGLRISLV